MNIPATRKQPSVSPPGQFPGQTQVRTQQHFAPRGTTPPVNIRSQTPEAAFEGQQLQYQRVARPTFSSSPTSYTQLGSSPHIQQVVHIGQAPQQVSLPNV
ncbi:hypothetical protein LSH36_181g04062 [Paralvinella palmiformis]|uniref:Uncharacterized protein n=1 Tax=Paralvinella palmiformis TaxID=53620 RepID=A0AAD9JS41_9ANNE|nr:hypothetical protein LSH36_181g04062 [Paralvinella palmiformis]